MALREAGGTSMGSDAKYCGVREDLSVDRLTRHMLPICVYGQVPSGLDKRRCSEN